VSHSIPCEHCKGVHRSFETATSCARRHQVQNALGDLPAQLQWNLGKSEVKVVPSPELGDSEMRRIRNLASMQRYTHRVRRSKKMM
jgi:hypothetical protein